MRRAFAIVGLLLCLALLGYAWYAQAVLRLEPCPLCIFQRVGIAPPSSFCSRPLQTRGAGRRVYGADRAAALATIGVAARHLWIQHLPPGAVPSCGATLVHAGCFAAGR